MSPRPRSGYRRPTLNANELHRRWLQLVDSDGPFLSIPVVKRVYPQGITTLSAGLVSELKVAKPVFEKAWDDFHTGDLPLEDYRTARDAWVEVVLRRLCGWGALFDTDGPHPSVTSPNGKVTVTATGSFSRKGETAALVWVIDPVRSLRDLGSDGWATDSIDRMEQLLRDAQVPIGVVTDGRWWGLVSAQPKISAASGIVDSQTWIEEPPTRDAVAALLSPKSLAGGAAADRLAQMFSDSVTAAEDITEALGSQVRRAVELLVQSFSETAEDAVRRGDPNPLPADGDEIYAAAVTVMMRVVFLLFAEERDLLPQGELFDSGYGLTGQLDALRLRVEQEGQDGLGGTSAVWHRLLATSRALFRGATFEDLRLPAYGGSLFDPTRFPFLGALTERGTLALPVNDLTMLYVLESVQMADVKGEGKRPISFRDIDVEQIGYIYEGLLGYTCRYADETMIGLIGKAGAEPEIPLRELASIADQHADDKQIAAAILAWVKKDQPAATPPSASALTKALSAGDTLADAALAISAVTHDPELADELRSWIGIIRRDLRDRPTVVKKGGLLVVETPSRKNAGAHYTPRALAEEVVLHALEPLVYSPGPYQSPDREAWVLKSPEEILDLKVADIACGSGAFLVAAARYLGARLVEAWNEAGVALGTPHEQETDAIRQVVARCLYGADINPMAIEMCKLSLWLVSLDPKLPFSFVDDKMLVGNSLLGITDLAQLETMHIDPSRTHGDQTFFTVTLDGYSTALDVRGTINKAIRLREALSTEVDNNDPQRSARAKQNQLKRLHETTAQLRDIADGVIAAGLRLGGKPGKALDEAYENLRIAVSDAYPTQGTPDRTYLDTILDAGLTPTVETDYGRWKPLHWVIELPEIFEQGGFDAVIGNPPFLGGPKVTGAMGENVHDTIANFVGSGTKGKADLVAFFFLRAIRLLQQDSPFGLVATNTISEGDTREVGLDSLIRQDISISRCIKSAKWPGKAQTQYAAVWGRKGRLPAGFKCVADDVECGAITTLLEPGDSNGRPAVRLSDNRGYAAIGVYVLGAGFILDAERAAILKQEEGNSIIIKPYMTGEDLNESSAMRPTGWIIDFDSRPLSEASQYTAIIQHVEEHVKPTRDVVNRAAYRDKWWQYADRKDGPRAKLGLLEHCIAIRQTSSTLMPARVRTETVFDKTIVTIADDSFSTLALLSLDPPRLVRW